MASAQFDQLDDLTTQWPDKAAVRLLHEPQRRERLRQQREFIRSAWPKLNDYFADGDEVCPAKISPRMELVSADTWQADLFRLASLTWSVPVSQGHGRRLRFLVWDDANDCLMGLIALGDPVFNLRARDTMIGWDATGRQDRLVHVMEAFVLGAVPPYSELLAGKLVACLVRTVEVRDAFAVRYRTRQGIISKIQKFPSLVLVTTSSALGRSSIYNRLRLSNQTYFRSIGSTSGWGHFHVPPSVFALVRRYLAIRRHHYRNNHAIGDGPNWRLRAIKLALSLIGLDPNLLRHGIQRQLFVSCLASNAVDFLSGKALEPKYDDLLSVKEVADLACARWLQPRAERSSAYRAWRTDNLLQLLGSAALRIPSHGGVSHR